VIDRISIALAVALHLGIIMLLARLTFEVPEDEPQVSSVDIKFRGVQDGIDDPSPPLADAPEPSQDLDARAASQDIITDLPVEQMPEADALPEPLPVSNPAPQALAAAEPEPAPPPRAEELLAVAEPAPVPRPVPVPLVVPAPTPTPEPFTASEMVQQSATVPVPQPVTASAGAPSSAESRLAVSALADALPQPPERTRPRLTATVLSGLRGAVGSQATQSRLNSATIGSAIAGATPRGLQGLTMRQKTDLAQKVREQVMPCWKPPASDAPIAGAVRLRFRLDRKGAVIGLPAQVGPTDQSGPNAAYLGLLANSGRRAILMCAPLRLPADLYEAWSEVEVEFDPRDLR
jgi:hypothetical protein